MRDIGIALGIVCLALAVALADGSSGFRYWWRLQGDLEVARQRMEDLRAEIRALEAESEALADEEFAIETAIREDLKLARPGEIVVVIPDGAAAASP